MIALILLLSFASVAFGFHNDDDDAQLLPTGKRITPLATPGSQMQSLNPGLPDFPAFIAGQALSVATSPDFETLLVLTSGYNRNNGPDGKAIKDASEEYVFVYDISKQQPRKTQVLKVPDTFAGIAFSPEGSRFFVSGGKDDNLHTFSLSKGKWDEDGAPIR